MALPGTDGVANSYILQGVQVVVVGPNLNVSAGYIFYDGEVIKVDAHVIPDAGIAVQHFFALRTSFDPGGLKTFQDLSVNNTHQIRRVELTHANLEVDPGPGNRFVFNRTTLSATTFLELSGLTEWFRLDAGILEIFTKLNTNAAGTGTDHAPESLGPASYFKYKVVGKTVYFQFLLDQLEMLPSSGPVGPTYYGAASIVISLLPQVRDSFKGEYLLERVNKQGPAGKFTQSAVNASSKLVLEADYHYNNFKQNPGNINDELETVFDTPTVVFTVGVSFGANPIVTASGSGSYELL